MSLSTCSRPSLGSPPLLVLLVLGLAATGGPMLAAAEDAGKIMRPADRSWYQAGPVDLIATAESGKLQLDGAAIPAEQPFPTVFHATLTVSPGVHTVILIWEGGRKEVRFFVGANAPEGYRAFRQHPPLPGIQCASCHALNTRGRFVFKGGCFDCHQQAGFTKVHTHEPAILEQCGVCHNAHGSTVKAHLLYSKEVACKICHN
jgi:predicted CXXCH cytochrome family protein